MEFFTWQGLVTSAEATLAAAAITQLLKDIGIFKRIPTRLISYLAALTVLAASTLATAGFDIKKLALTLLNAVVVALASNGAYDAVALAKRD